MIDKADPSKQRGGVSSILPKSMLLPQPSGMFAPTESSTDLLDRNRHAGHARITIDLRLLDIRLNMSSTLISFPIGGI